MSFLNKMKPEAIFKALSFFGIDIEKLAEEYMPKVVDYVKKLELQAGCKLMATVCLDTDSATFIFSLYKVDATGAMTIFKEYRLTDLKQIIQDFKNGKFTSDADAGHHITGITESIPAGADGFAGLTGNTDATSGPATPATNDGKPGGNDTGFF